MVKPTSPVGTYACKKIEAVKGGRDVTDLCALHHSVHLDLAPMRVKRLFIKANRSIY